MMLPERMSKIRIVAPKTLMEKIVKELHSMKALHIEDHSKSDLDIGEPFANAEKVSELLIIVRSLISYFKINQKPKTIAKIDLGEIEKNIRLIHKEVIDRQENLKALDERIKSAKQLQSELQQLGEIGLPIESYTGYKNISSIVGKTKNPDVLKKKLEKITDKFQINSSDGLFALFIETEKETEAYDLLNSLGFSELQIESALKLKGSPEANMQKISKDIIDLQKQQQSKNDDLQKLNRNWQNNLVSYERILARELEKAEAPLKFASTKNIFVATGWVPSKALPGLKQKLDRISLEKAYIREEEFEDEEAPVKLENPKVARPFEFLINLRGLPLYNEADPTLMLFLTFPLFFGFMLGDIGYGIVTLLLSLFLRAKLGNGPKSLMTIMAIASASSILFGFVFGEFFGEEEILGIAIPHLIGRAEEEGIQQLLIASLILGAIHLNLGLIIGFFNELRHHGLKSAILEKFSWFLIEGGAPFILGSLNIIKTSQEVTYISMALFFIGVIMLAIGEMKIGSIGAFKAIVESITIFSNTLSYARLMAVGLASVQLAIIINEFAKESFHQGSVVSIILGIAILFFGHLLNIVLGMLGSFLHSLRLEYVEFFTKFFIGGAKPYKPFGENTAR